MTLIEQHIAERLAGREQAGNLRQLRRPHAAIDFFSNDYLGIASSRLLGDLLKGCDTGTGSTGSRLLSGNSEAAGQLEDTIAGFHKAEAALLFNSGYDANIGLITAISDRHSILIYDELCHASLVDGIRLSQGTGYKFAHNDTAALKKKLELAKDKGPKIIITESVFSMDGDIAPLKEIAELADQYDAALIVDEAHATGVFGKKGEGLVNSMGLEDKVFARVHTFGKAMGCHGAVVLGSGQVKQFLVNFARTFIYTTALPPHSISNITAAYQYLSQPGFSNSRLHELITYFRKKIMASAMEGWKDSQSAIQVLVTGGNDKAKAAATALQNAGLQINAILHPTVPAGEERLRICLHTFNTKEEIDKIFTTLSELHV